MSASESSPAADLDAALAANLAQARTMTIAGPPTPAYEGQDVLDDELLWLNEEQLNTEQLQERAEEAEERIRAQGPPLSNHWIAEYTGKGNKYWSKFYHRNADRFYKDRHYLTAEFPELADESSGPLRLLEVGCGVGNAVLPLLETNSQLSVVAIDFADSAIRILSQHPLAIAVPAEGGLAPRLQCSVCDVVNDVLPVAAGSMDIVLCMFVLSAVAPSRLPEALAKLASCLRPGGLLLFRDYGRHDEAQLRFKKNTRLGDNFYVRQDGTCAYYFTLEEIIAVCEAAGLGPHPMQGRCKYVRRVMANRAQRVARHRVWIQGVFVRGGGGGDVGSNVEGEGEGENEGEGEDEGEGGGEGEGEDGGGGGGNGEGGGQREGKGEGGGGGGGGEGGGEEGEGGGEEEGEEDGVTIASTMPSVGTTLRKTKASIMEAYIENAMLAFDEVNPGAAQSNRALRLKVMGK